MRSEGTISQHSSHMPNNTRVWIRLNDIWHSQRQHCNFFPHAQSKVVLGRSGPISFHRLNRQESAEILRKQKFRILTSLNLDNFHFFGIIELGKFQNLFKSHQRLQEHINHHTSSSETNASCSRTTTIPCPCRNNIMVCIYSSFFLFETILTRLSRLEITCSYAPGW